MKILITGSNGIIGQQLLSQLLDVYPTAEFVVINRTAPTSLDTKRVRSIEADILSIDKRQADLIFANNRAELFFHLAWDTGHSNYLNTTDNIKWEAISIILIDSFYSSGGKRFIGMGSSIEYDWTIKNTFKENSSPTGSKWLYGQSKLAVYNHLASLSNVSYLWCRIFFVFGPGQGKTRLVPLIINNALNGGEALTINLELKRDYISTFEIARQIIMMQQTNYSGAVNICSGRAIKLRDIVDCIGEITKTKVTLMPVEYQDGFEIEILQGSIGLINQYYKEYTYSLDNFYEDIKKTIDVNRLNRHSTDKLSDKL